MTNGSSRASTRVLASLGWSEFFSAQLAEVTESLRPVRVVAVSRQSFEIQSATFRQAVRMRDAPRLSERPTTGDWLLWDDVTREPVRLLNQKNVLRRRQSGHEHRTQTMLANFERIFLVVSANQNFNESRLERGLVLAAQSKVVAEIVLTKIDQCADPALFRDRLHQIPLLPQVHEVDARDASSCQGLASLLHTGETTALLGSSGVGKSTLINTLLGKELQATQTVRDQDAKGRHTTIRRTLIQLPSGAMVVDNPGVRELGILDGEDAIAVVFGDISELADRCRFNDCQHSAEPGCAVRDALRQGGLAHRRFNNYAKLLLEARPSTRYT